MYKIRRVKFEDHPILGDLDLNFCDSTGRAVDTVIIAGENGIGKSTILESLYKIATHTVDIPMIVDFENDECRYSFRYWLKDRPNDTPLTYVNDGKKDIFISNTDFKNNYTFCGIYSDVDINFHSNPIRNITSTDLDTTGESRRSTVDLANQINQLLVDIQNIDDSIFAQKNRPLIKANEPGIDTTDLERMPRFINAFNKMFDQLKFVGVQTVDQAKTIMFTKNGAQFSIEHLSSGEKQIVYRGCFLLRDVNATQGAFVFIDEPEISLHPLWQQKVMNFYKDIFTNNNGKQTSQIFAVTHSPFIVHNDYRYNDKVIVLTDNNGKIAVMDKPEYYKCNSPEVVQDAFLIDNFLSDQPIVYVEGETDEKYFNKVLEVYGEQSVPFKFKWIGRKDGGKSAKDGGQDSLAHAAEILRIIKPSMRYIFLYDSDTSHKYKYSNNIYELILPKYDNSKNIVKGIENALNFGDIDTTKFLEDKYIDNGYGGEDIREIFNKNKCCNYICSQSTELLKGIFVNLKEVIDMLEKLLNGEDCSEYFGGN